MTFVRTLAGSFINLNRIIRIERAENGQHRAWFINELDEVERTYFQAADIAPALIKATRKAPRRTTAP